MMKNLKFALQSMKYAHNKKMYFMMVGIFLAFGMLNFIIAQSNADLMVSGYIIGAAPILFCQMYRTFTMSNLVLSSSKKKAYITTIEGVLNAAAMLLGYLMVTVVYSVLFFTGSISLQTLGFLLMSQGIMMSFISLYMTVSYKLYVVSTVVFIVAFFALFLILFNVAERIDTIQGISFAGEVCIGIFSLVAGIVLHNAASVLLYKRHIDKIAMRSMLR